MVRYRSNDSHYWLLLHQINMYTDTSYEDMLYRDQELEDDYNRMMEKERLTEEKAEQQGDEQDRQN